MKSKTKLKLIVLSAAAAAASLIAGCKIGETTVASFLKDKGAENQTVTYYANGGYFNGMNSIVEKNIYYPENGLVLTDFDKIDSITMERTNYIFDGWYYARLEDGKPVKSEDGRFVESSGIPVDTSKKLNIPAGEHWYFCAQWLEDVKLDFILVTEDGGAVTTESGKVEQGQVVGSKYFGKSNSVTLNEKDAPESSDYTFYDFYEDEECTKPFSGTVAKPESGAENPVIYAKYIKGKWTMVRNSSDVQDMLNGLYKQENYYLLNTDGSSEFVIDCSNLPSFGLLDDNYNECNATIKGNGVTLTGIKFKQDSISQGSSLSIFGSISEKANISDITFKDLTVEAQVRNSAIVNLYLIAANAADGAKLENVAFENVTFTVTIPNDSSIGNIQKSGSGEYQTGNWLCGGVDGSDEKFLEKFTGLDIKNAELRIGTRGKEEKVAVFNAADNQ